MIKVEIRAGGIARDVLATPNQILRDFLSDNGISLSENAVRMDGVAVLPSSLDLTFNELNITNSVRFSSIIKTTSGV